MSDQEEQTIKEEPGEEEEGSPIKIPEEEGQQQEQVEKEEQDLIAPQQVKQEEEEQQKLEQEEQPPEEQLQQEQNVVEASPEKLQEQIEEKQQEQQEEEQKEKGEDGEEAEAGEEQNEQGEEEQQEQKEGEEQENQEEEKQSEMEEPYTDSSGLPSKKKLNPVVEWIKQKVEFSDFNAETMWGEAQDQTIDQFLSTPDDSKIYCFIENGQFYISSSTPPKLDEESAGFQYFIKNRGSVTLDNAEQKILIGIVEGKNLMNLLDIMNNHFIPCFTAQNLPWPESVRKEFISQLQTFMLKITEQAWKQKNNQTVLYIPNENLQDIENTSKDKDLTQRLENAVIKWTQQIKFVVNNQESQQESENDGPLEEIEYWRKRNQNLNFIAVQLEKPNLLRICNFLKITNSQYLDQFLELAQKIKQRTDEANNNLEHLKKLNNPCSNLKEAAPKDIQKIIPEILNQVKDIYKNSQFYNSPDLITGLLRKISNEIIKRCRSTIDINDMLYGDVLKCMRDLDESKQCGEQ